MVWAGRVEDLKATDPRGSNLLYSTLVGPVPPVPPLPPLSREHRKDGAPSGRPAAAASPVALSFRYAKERGGGMGNPAGVSVGLLPAVSVPAAAAAAVAAAAAGDGGGREGDCGLWESSDLSLSFTELQVWTCTCFSSFFLSFPVILTAVGFLPRVNPFEAGCRNGRLVCIFTFRKENQAWKKLGTSQR